MGATIAEKVLAKKSGRDHVDPGEYVAAKLDVQAARGVWAIGI